MSAVDKAGRPTHWCLYLFRVAPAPILLALSLLGISPFGVAEEPDWVELPITPDAYQENWLPGERDTYTGWLIDQRTAWSYRIGNLGRNLDGFFAGEEAQWRSNESYMKLSLHNTFRKSGEMDTEPRIKLRLDLPDTKRKFRLIIENDPEEDKSVQERTRYRSLTSTERARSRTTGAIRYMFDELDQWKLSTDLGIRARLPPDPFVRGRASREWDLVSDWNARLNQQVYYYVEDGLGETTELYFERGLSPDSLFRVKSEAQWSQREARFEFAQVFSILQRIDMKRGAEWQIGVLGESQPTFWTTAYFANVTYRRLLYKDWLFYEITPELLFPRDDDFRANPSLTFGLEVLFSEH